MLGETNILDIPYGPSFVKMYKDADKTTAVYALGNFKTRMQFTSLVPGMAMLAFNYTNEDQREVKYDMVKKSSGEIVHSLANSDFVLMVDTKDSMDTLIRGLEDLRDLIFIKEAISK